MAACARLVESGRVGPRDPKVLAGQLWSMVHGFVTLELSCHFADFDDPVTSVLLPLGANLAVGLGDEHARAWASREVAAKTHAEVPGIHRRPNDEVPGPALAKESEG